MLFKKFSDKISCAGSLIALIFGFGWDASAVMKFEYDEIVNLRNPDQFECLFLGDTYYGEVYQRRYQSRHEPHLDLTDKKGYDQSAQNFRQLLKDSDLNIANLATPITNRKKTPLASLSKEYVHKADVQRTPGALRRHKIHVVSLGNNHALDFGIDGLFQTQELLRRKKIKHFGSGNNSQDALKPYLFKALLSGEKEFKVAVIGALEERESYRNSRFDFYANQTRAGVAALNEERIGKLVQQLREFDKDIFIILFPHWGRDYEKVTVKQQVLTESWKKMGINAVIGHGSHIAHPIAIEGNQITAYSIGNFIFNSMGRYEKKYTTAYSLVVKLIKPADSDRVKFRFYPIYGDNTDVKFIPRLVGPDEFLNVLDYLKVKNTPGYQSGRDQQGWFFEVDIKDHLN